MPQPSSPAQFIEKWERTQLSELAASPEHFIDLCKLLGQPTPAEHDATGAEYTFQKGVVPTGGASRGSAGERGYADVWWRKKFAWEYKRKGKYRDLVEAYRQLCQYREALENPPLLVVSDIARTEIHTNFTGTAKEVHAIALADFDKPESLSLLRRVFTDPDSFKPKQTTESVTKEIAERFSTIARSLRQFGGEAHPVAHFLMKCMFCLFAEDVELLPKDLFKKLVNRYKSEPARLAERMTELFRLMRTGGDFGSDPIKHFNGGLFDEAPALRLNANDIGVLLLAGQCDWGSVEPAIFGTLFERSLDPNTRAQIGAHYTSRDDIMLVVEPVVMAPLRREWESVKAEVETLLAKRAADPKARKLTKLAKGKAKPASSRRASDTASAAGRKIEDALRGFQERLAGVRILDPACGSGNFLYVAIQQLLDLEKEVITFAARRDISLGLFPQVRPTQLHGIEINPYAAELAQAVIWIGYLQWMRDNGFIDGISTPILEPLQSIECRDAILDLSDPKRPKPATWPDADFIIGNPPFLGCRHFRDSGLQDDYVVALWGSYTLPKTSDFCCYWFERARTYLQSGKSTRIGLLATQGIRGTDNRDVLLRLTRDALIFRAWSDRPWVLDGANVRVSIIAFSVGPSEDELVLDGRVVPAINADLTSGADAAGARMLSENARIAYMGDTKGGSFDVEWNAAREQLCAPNPQDVNNGTVVRPWINGSDLTKRHRSMWIVDFGCEMTKASAAMYEAPFRFVEEQVWPNRKSNRRESYAERWWIHVEPRPAMREALGRVSRFIATPRVAKYRVFQWCASEYLPDSRLFVFAMDTDYFFGILQSSLHEAWSLRMCSWHGDGSEGGRPTYNTSTCFETFPLPWPPGKEPGRNPIHKRIGEAAKALNEQRERWLNPPEWIEPIAKAIDKEDDFADVPKEARELIRHSAIMARAARDPKLKKRTLTNLYNERPTWLKLAHEALDRAVLAAYAAVDPEGEWAEDWARVWIDSGAGQPLPEKHELAERRKEIDQRVLANLLRMNLVRAG